MSRTRTSAADRRRQDLLRSVAVMAGGGVGALSRWAISLAFVAPIGSFPSATFLVNVSGAFGLGLAAVVMTERLPPTLYLRPLIGTGFFGAYTTFSTMAVEGVRLIDDGRVRTAFVYWMLTLLIGQAAGAIGMWAGRVRVRRGHDDREGNER